MIGMKNWVRTNSIQLHYLDHPGEMPPLVLMPGLTANAHSFDGLISAGLSPALRVLCLDWWGPTIESYYHADVEIRNDGTVKPRSRPEAIIEAVDSALCEDWPRHLAAINQPMLLLNAPDAFGPPGAPPVLPREHALATVSAVPDGRDVKIPGNHMTMLFGEGAERIVDAITNFVHA